MRELDIDFNEAPWLAVAIAEKGVKERPGPRKHNSRILEYLRSCRGGRWALGRDETPWCSAFVNWVLQQDGYAGTGSLAARSFAKYGVALSGPRYGAIAVFKRGRGGHVGFVEGWTPTGIFVRGGNQSNSVCVKRYPADRLLGYRWPAE